MGDSAEKNPRGILIADDCEVMVRVLCTLLNEGGHQVAATAADGIEAVRLFRQLNPELVIMDINMPRMNGLEATRRIIQLRPDAKVIILSIEVDKATVLQAMKCGAAHYIAKPIQPDRLLSIVGSLLAEQSVASQTGSG